MFRKPISNVYDTNEIIPDENIRKIIFGYDTLVKEGLIPDYSCLTPGERELHREQFCHYAQENGCTREEAIYILKIKICSVMHEQKNTIEVLKNYVDTHRFFGHKRRAESLMQACYESKSLKELDDLMQHQKDLFDKKIEGESDKSRPKHEREVKNGKKDNYDSFYEIVSSRCNRAR